MVGVSGLIQLWTCETSCRRVTVGTCSWVVLTEAYLVDTGLACWKVVMTGIEEGEETVVGGCMLSIGVGSNIAVVRYLEFIFWDF